MGWRQWLACCGAACLAVSHGVSTHPGVPIQEAAASANYTFTVIDHLVNCSGGAGMPVIGNSGDVAFIGHCDGTQVVRRGDGVTTIDIYRVGPGEPYSVPDTVVSINDHGTVAFAGGPIGGGSTGYSVVYGSGGPLTVAADTSVHTQWTELGRPSINNSDAVAFMAVKAGTGSYNTVILAESGGFTTIAEPGDTAPGAGTVLQAFEPALNNVGQVQIAVNTVEGVPGLYRGTGGALTKIIVGGAINTFNGINDSGRVAFGITSVGIKTGAGAGLTTIAGPDATFYFVWPVAAINNSNAVAFTADTTSGTKGVFVGDGLATQLVVQTGDVIPGLGTVTAVFTGEEAINEAGQVAFVVQYNDGEGFRNAIVRADPILPQVALKVAATATGCKKVNATVTLDRPAPPGGVVIDLSETNPSASIPASLKIASTKTSGKFTVNVTPVTSSQPGAITATLGSSVATKPFTVVPISVQTLTLTPNPVVGGNPVAGTATLECAAADDITIALSSTKPSVAQPAVPSLLLPAGTRTMNFEVNTADVAVASSAKINATANGITKSRKLTINP